MADELIAALERMLWELAVCLPEKDYVAVRTHIADLRAGNLVRREEAMRETLLAAAEDLRSRERLSAAKHIRGDEALMQAADAIAARAGEQS